MADIEKIIKGLEDIQKHLDTGYSYVISWKSELIRDTLTLLKEQEKAKVVFGRCKDGSFSMECGHCGMYLDKAYSICPKCNKELDWNKRIRLE